MVNAGQAGRIPQYIRDRDSMDYAALEARASASEVPPVAMSETAPRGGDHIMQLYSQGGIV